MRLEIGEGVITPSEISIILHGMKAEFNIVLLFIQNNS